MDFGPGGGPDKKAFPGRSTRLRLPVLVAALSTEARAQLTFDRKLQLAAQPAEGRHAGRFAARRGCRRRGGRRRGPARLLGKKMRNLVDQRAEPSLVVLQAGNRASLGGDFAGKVGQCG